MEKLNLGCGKDIRQGWLNLDCVPLPGVDIVHNLEEVPFPFNNDSLDEVMCNDVLEHLDYILVLREIHRILKPGGKVTIKVPHFTSSDAFSDPTHKKYFTVHTFEYFAKNTSRSNYNYYFDFVFSSLEGVRINFLKRPAYFYNSMLEQLINSNSKLQTFYEKSPLRIFPAWNLDVILVK